MPTMTRDKSSDVPEADRDWFGGRRWTGIAAIGVIILVGLCALVLVLVHRNNSGSTQGAPARNTASTRVSPSSSLPTTIPTEAPHGTTWSIYETVALPSIAGEGPSHVTGSIATGYAHTPTGALLAVVNEGYRYALAPDQQWQAAAKAMLAPGAGYDAWLKIRAAHPYGSAGATGNDPTQIAQVAGYQFASYTPGDAVVQVVTRDSDGNLQVGVDHVRWDGTDWKYVLTNEGSQTSNVQQLEDLTGFIPWAGV